MGTISENPVLNPDAGQQLAFQILEPEVQQRVIPEIPDPEPLAIGEQVSEEVADEKPSPRSRPIRRTTTPGRHRRPENQTPDSDDEQPRPPKIAAPNFREWHDFTSNFVLKWILRGYVAYVFRGIDRERILNAAELKAIEPDAEMLSSASKPLAHMANRSKIMRKHGRAIIDSAEGLESLIAVGMWMHTVNRIARSHETDRKPSPERKKSQNVNSRPDQSREAESSGPNVAEESRGTVRVLGDINGNGRAYGIGG